MMDEALNVEIAKLKESQKQNTQDHIELKQGNRDIWDVITNIRDNLIDELKKRPPLWASSVIQIQSTIIGILITAIVAILLFYLGKR